MTRAKRPILALIISLLLLVAVGLAIWQLSPSSWLIEIPVVALLTISLWLVGGWVIGRRKLANLAVLFLIVILLMNRWGILNWITLGLWISVVGLISLIN